MFLRWTQIAVYGWRECVTILVSRALIPHLVFKPCRPNGDANWKVGHLCNLHRPREGLRPRPEGGDLENHEGEAGTRKMYSM